MMKTMKAIYRSSLALVAALLLTPSLLHAEDDTKPAPGEYPDGVVLNKTVAPDPSNADRYNITLESFVTGQVTKETSETALFNDILLVLDTSGSMGETYTGSNETSTPYPVSPITFNTFYDEGNTRRHYGGVGTTGNVEIPYYIYYEGEYCKVDMLCKEFYQSNGGRYQMYLTFTTSKGVTYYMVKGLNNGLPVPQNDSRIKYEMVSGIGYQYVPNLKCPGGSSSAERDEVVWDGTLYRMGNMKEDHLRGAVMNFVDVIEKNSEGLEAGKSNRVSIIQFNNDDYPYSNYTKSGTNYLKESAKSGSSSVVKQFVEVITGTGKDKELKNAIGSLEMSGNTAADYGMTLAQEMLKASRAEANKIVIMFTDGEPNHKSGFDGTVANTTITKAQALKAAGVEVYTVGIFDSNNTNMDNVRKYMNGVSSNYPNATAYTSLGSGSDQGYFIDASTGGLEGVFKTIAEEITSGGATISLTETTQIIDYIAPDFTLPEGATSADITVAVAPCTKVNSKEGDPTTYEFGEAKTLTAYGLTDKISCTVSTQEQKVVVTGFDYEEHFVGEVVDKDANISTPRGYKLVVTVPIEVAPDSKGGVDLPTNGEDSGIYVDLDGDGDVDPLGSFEVPKTDIPNLVIVKTGLKAGDKAMFNVWKLDGEGKPVGKPLQLVAIGKGEDTPVFVEAARMDVARYMVQEATWAWSYTPAVVSSYTDDDSHTVADADKLTVTRNINADTQTTTADYVGTVFQFTNTAKKDVPAHGEDGKNNVFPE